MKTDRMRLKLALIVMLGLPAVAAAQTAGPVTGGVAPLPPIGLPLPRIGLPLPPIGLPATAAPQRQGATLPMPRMRTQHRSGISALPAYGWPYFYEARAASTGGPRDGAPTRPLPQPLAGRLRLDGGSPGEPQRYIGG